MERIASERPASKAGAFAPRAGRIDADRPRWHLRALSPREAADLRGERPYEFRRSVLAGRVRIAWWGGRPRVLTLVIEPRSADRRCA